MLKSFSIKKRNLKYYLTLVLLNVLFCSISYAQWFTDPVINPFNLDTVIGAAAPSFGDLDNDGDFDMFSGKYYYENIGTAEEPDFAAPIYLPFGLDSINTYGVWVDAMGDLDNDGDLDIIGNFEFSENIGSAIAPEFEESIYLPGLGGFCVEWTENLSLNDIDNDADLDFIVGSCDHEFITWTESLVLFTKNIGDSDSLVIDTALFAGLSISNLSQESFGDPSMADLDDDGDLDLLVGGRGLSLGIYYYENIGTAENLQLDTAIINPFGIEFPYNYASPAFTDLDNDGDQDLMIGLSNGTFMYYEHDASLSINDHSNENQLTIYPNPTQNDLAIESDLIITEIQFFDQLGRAVMLIQNPSALISIGHLNPGLFILKFTLQDGSHSYSKVLKE